MKITAALIVGLLGSSLAAQTLVPVGRGNYRADGIHGVPTTMLAGQQFGFVFRHYLAYDLSGVEGEITAASLRLDLISLSSAIEFSSPDGMETYALYDVSSDIGSLVAGTGGTAAFDDLGTGTFFGSRVVTDADVGTTVVVDLNADAVAAMNAASGLFALGGAITSLAPDPGLFDFEFAFGGGGVPYEQTVLEITTAPPECLLIVGQAPGASRFVALDHVFETQLNDVQASYAVLMESLPEFVLPVADDGIGLAPVLGQRPNGQKAPLAAPPRWLLDGHAVVQIVLWNPGVFPALPEQCSVGLAVQVLPGGDVSVTPFGQGVGIQIDAEVVTTAAGQRAVRFPFSIDGL